MGKFKVGDRVIFTADAIGLKLTGTTGTVIQGVPVIFCRDQGAWVKLDKPIEKQNQVWVFDDKLELIKPEKQPVIVITSDGKTTTATKRLGKKVICSATARCSDDDTFDFNTGAELAFRRLREKEMPVPEEATGPKEFKVVCTELHGNSVGEFTIGKIYTIEREAYDELRILGDRAQRLPFNPKPRYWAEEDENGNYRVSWSAHTYALFIPLVED
jgi:hypothetical protein